MKVLLATDGSADATDAARFFANLKFAELPEVTVVTVSYDPSRMHPESIHPWFPEWLEKETERVSTHHQLVEKLISENCQSVTKLRREGDPARVILEEAKKAQADLIVVGARGHSMVHRILLGSVSDHVASHAECSVLVVRPNQDKGKPPQRILFGYDSSKASREAAAELTEINWGRDTEINVVSVSQQPHVFVGESYVAEPLTLEPKLVEKTRCAAERMASQIATHFPKTNTQVPVSDHVGDAIVEVAESWDADLLMIGDTGHSFFGDLLLGSTSKYIIRHAPCSVWISRHHIKASSDDNEVADVAAAK